MCAGAPPDTKRCAAACSGTTCARRPKTVCAEVNCRASWTSSRRRARRAAGGARARLRSTFGNTGRAGAWGGSGPIDAARTCAKEVVQALNDALSALRSRALAGVMPYIVEFVRAEALHRGREGALVFDDLILRTRDILRHDKEARFRLKDRYDAVLIDEFQDTDPLQAEIAQFYAGEPDERPRPAALFLVGDPKQSIYRFRRADMAIYARSSRVEPAGSRAVQLSLNRRCGQDRVVNGIRQADRRRADPEGAARSTELAAARDVELHGPAVAAREARATSLHVTPRRAKAGWSPNYAPPRD